MKVSKFFVFFETRLRTWLEERNWELACNTQWYRHSQSEIVVETAGAAFTFINDSRRDKDEQPFPQSNCSIASRSLGMGSSPTRVYESQSRSIYLSFLSNATRGSSTFYFVLSTIALAHRRRIVIFRTTATFYKSRKPRMSDVYNREDPIFKCC